MPQDPFAPTALDTAAQLTLQRTAQEAQAFQTVMSMYQSLDRQGQMAFNENVQQAVQTNPQAADFWNKYTGGFGFPVTAAEALAPRETLSQGQILVNPQTGQEIARGLPRESTGVSTIFDPDSPTGRRIVSKEQAVGQPGPPPTRGLEMEFGPDGRPTRITQGGSSTDASTTRAAMQGRDAILERERERRVDLMTGAIADYESFLAASRVMDFGIPGAVKKSIFELVSETGAEPFAASVDQQKAFGLLQIKHERLLQQLGRMQGSGRGSEPSIRRLKEVFGDLGKRPTEKEINSAVRKSVSILVDEARRTAGKLNRKPIFDMNLKELFMSIKTDLNPEGYIQPAEVPYLIYTWPQLERQARKAGVNVQRPFVLD